MAAGLILSLLCPLLWLLVQPLLGQLFCLRPCLAHPTPPQKEVLALLPSPWGPFLCTALSAVALVAQGLSCGLCLLTRWQEVLVG